ncbi:hypothetical protein BZJ19_11625 [Salinivibrio proteolyticus]|uniref:hypothetical protein n=1 Tax=Salinivibrio proteolyticus TaxID=334715 RepID=UPI0009896928|nr:hypothetical protein [Salinivibrio proteolyticus]OOF24021.1 hypothetical protein BZJ19_11625 [Salinivibrio proteolyticus]
MSIIVNIKSKQEEIEKLQKRVDHLQENFDQVLEQKLEEYQADHIGGLNYGYLIEEFGEDMVLGEFAEQVKIEIATLQAQIEQLQQ